MKSVKIQSGFTLLEMVIAISILAIMLSAVIFAFDGSKSRAQVMVASMEEYGGALQRLKTDGSCYPRKLSALFDMGEATGSANSFCGASLEKQWNGPYVKPVNVTATGSVKLGQIAPDIEMGIIRAESTYSGGAIPTYKWYLKAVNVPSEIATQFMLACNGSDDQNAGGGATAKKCSSSQAGATPKSETGNVVDGSTPVAIGQAELVVVDLLFDETRR